MDLLDTNMAKFYDFPTWLKVSDKSFILRVIFLIINCDRIMFNNRTFCVHYVHEVS